MRTSGTVASTLDFPLPFSFINTIMKNINFHHEKYDFYVNDNAPMIECHFAGRIDIASSWSMLYDINPLL
jgi:hypothetical protein